MSFALVIGAGPAGLMAAEELGRAGHKVVVVEAKPSVARKFLMAGKSGLNLTKDEPSEDFLAAYGAAADWLRPMLADFGPAQVQTWAEGLGQPLFTGSSGRVFPEVMKASPLLRAWLLRLDGYGVEVRTRWRWTGWSVEAARFDFETPQGPQTLSPAVTVLACGGASWARLGSDGAWAEWLPETAPFQPANMGFEVAWSTHMQPHFGQPLKNIVLKAGDQQVRAECVLSERGIEGGGIYAVSRALREGAKLHLDLVPDLSEAQLRDRLAAVGKKQSTKNRLRKGARLDAAKLALVMKCARPSPVDLAPVLKALPVPLQGPRPMDEAISTAGGLRLSALDDGLQLKAMPAVYAAGEMLDWEAPTGGYLLTACLATGRWAGIAAAKAMTSGQMDTTG
ncbi:TIGR03862 family flavoprotein [Thalassobius sp. MITS945101]|uniref:TIGR03862 family flavoprotein n=1 Tax=Thalassobius sp. MITS945101 TaxID=3096994 RepID=UPI00399AB24B